MSDSHETMSRRWVVGTAGSLALLLLAACGTTGTGTNDTSSAGQTLGGYVATGSIDPANAEGTRTGNDDTVTGGGTGRNAGARYLDIITTVNWMDFRGGGGNVGSAATGPLSFEDTNGYGVAVNAFFSRNLSGEFGIGYSRPQARLTGGFGTIIGDEARIIPLTAVLQWHFLPERTWDPYVGAGGAYVMMDEVGGFTPVTGVQQIEFDDQASFLVNAGLGIGLGRSFGIVLDAKYLPLDAGGRTTFTGGAASNGEMELNPFIFSAGLRFGF